MAEHFRPTFSTQNSALQWSMKVLTSKFSNAHGIWEIWKKIRRTHKVLLISFCCVLSSWCTKIERKTQKEYWKIRETESVLCLAPLTLIRIFSAKLASWEEELEKASSKENNYFYFALLLFLIKILMKDIGKWAVNSAYRCSVYCRQFNSNSKNSKKETEKASELCSSEWKI